MMFLHEQIEVPGIYNQMNFYKRVRHAWYDYEHVMTLMEEQTKQATTTARSKLSCVYWI